MTAHDVGVIGVGIVAAVFLAVYFICEWLIERIKAKWKIQ